MSAAPRQGRANEAQPPRPDRGAGANKTRWGGWGREITFELLRKPETVDELYGHAVTRFRLPDTDSNRLGFHTLCVHLCRQFREGLFCERKLPGGTLPTLGGTFTKLVAARHWQGANGDEDKARACLRKLDRDYGDA